MESSIIQAVGVSITSRDDPARATRIEHAMAQAVTEAIAAGIGLDDVETFRQRMAAARRELEARN